MHIIAKKADFRCCAVWRIRYCGAMSTTRIERRTKIAKARNILGEVISRSRYAGEVTVLVNRRKEAAVIVPYDFYERAIAALGETRELVETEDDD